MRRKRYRNSYDEDLRLLERAGPSPNLVRARMRIGLDGVPADVVPRMVQQLASWARSKTRPLPRLAEAWGFWNLRGQRMIDRVFWAGEIANDIWKTLTPRTQNQVRPFFTMVSRDYVLEGYDPSGSALLRRDLEPGVLDMVQSLVSERGQENALYVASTHARSGPTSRDRAFWRQVASVLDTGYERPQ